MNVRFTVSISTVPQTYLGSISQSLTFNSYHIKYSACLKLNGILHTKALIRNALTHITLLRSGFQTRHIRSRQIHYYSSGGRNRILFPPYTEGTGPFHFIGIPCKRKNVNDRKNFSHIKIRLTRLRTRVLVEMISITKTFKFIGHFCSFLNRYSVVCMCEKI